MPIEKARSLELYHSKHGSRQYCEDNVSESHKVIGTITGADKYIVVDTTVINAYR